MRQSLTRTLTLIAAALLLTAGGALAADAAPHRVLLEAESFDNPGGWKLDTQFIEIMGSPYMLAHGLGRPVADATTTVEFPAPGKYHVYVRTKDWVARWGATGAPGKFQVLINGQPLSETFGTKGADWSWHDGGTVTIPDKKATLALHDLTGFDGRCDAIYFTSADNDAPPAGDKILSQWRRNLLGLSAEPKKMGPYDLVVVGGGFAGTAAAISAARMGCKVALIQDRPVLGGNGSSEVRVWSQGKIRRGKYPMIGEIVAEFADNARSSPGEHDEFGDAKKIAIVKAEPNIDLFLNHHAYSVETEGGKITSVTTLDTRTSQWQKFTGRLFADCTGHATIGYLAGAKYDETKTGHMGMSNMWKWDDADHPVSFPQTPWALDLKKGDFPYPRHGKGEWFWETGFDKDPIADLEEMRDWNLRAVYGAFSAMKHGVDASQHVNSELTWIAYIGGPRESRRLIGDVVLAKQDIVDKKDYPDGCVPSTWNIDLHYPKKQYAKKFPDNPFISYAQFDSRVDRDYGYPIPYRCFYSINVPNLFMAGRDISVTHEALGTTRVMRTCGMEGEVVGKAASICIQHDTTPRGVYENYWGEMDKLLKLHGVARRDNVNGDFYVRKDAAQLAPVEEVHKGISPAALPGIIVDDEKAKKSGAWSSGQGLPVFVGPRYLYAAPGSNAGLRFEFTVPKSGKYEVRMSWQPHENRSTKTKVTITAADGDKTVTVNEKKDPDKPHGFGTLGVFDFQSGKTAAVTITTDGADGYVNADAVQILPVN